MNRRVSRAYYEKRRRTMTAKRHARLAAEGAALLDAAREKRAQA